jgi:hypothetical protein
MKRDVLTIFFLVFILSCSERTVINDRDKIRAAIGEQLKTYPSSTLKDIYKSFFQDRYGPGHLLSDTTAARNYLLSELSGMQSRQRYVAEPCGLGENFVRVPLDLVKDSLVELESYFNAFLDSSKGFAVPDLEKWQKDWDDILGIMEGMELDIVNFEQDKKEISEMLARGETMVHHSDLYREWYAPHYRIMTREQWDQLSEKMIPVK